MKHSLTLAIIFFRAGKRIRRLTGFHDPPMLLILDMVSGKEAAAVRIDDNDVCYDVNCRRIYVSCGDGFIDIIGAGNYKLIEKIPTASGVRTSLFVPELNRFYLAAPHRGN
jgi:hypothetical protein